MKVFNVFIFFLIKNKFFVKKKIFYKRFVTLVSVGINDIKLITLKGKKYIKCSNVILFDNLINKNLLNYTDGLSICLYVGKRSYYQSFAQEIINKIIVLFFLNKNNVIRLKCGDSFIYSRGGEEIDFLLKYNIKFHIIPGITSASGISSYFYIPLTYRKFCNTLVYINGYSYLNNYTINDYLFLCKKNYTIVVYMGFYNFDIFIKKFIFFCRYKNIMISLISNGLSINQNGFIMTIKNILGFKLNIKSPSLMIIGKAINIRNKIFSYKNKIVFF